MSVDVGLKVKPNFLGVKPELFSSITMRSMRTTAVLHMPLLHSDEHFRPQFLVEELVDARDCPKGIDDKIAMVHIEKPLFADSGPFCRRALGADAQVLGVAPTKHLGAERLAGWLHRE